MPQSTLPVKSSQHGSQSAQSCAESTVTAPWKDSTVQLSASITLQNSHTVTCYEKYTAYLFEFQRNCMAYCISLRLITSYQMSWHTLTNSTAFFWPKSHTHRQVHLIEHCSRRWSRLVSNWAFCGASPAVTITLHFQVQDLFCLYEHSCPQENYCFPSLSPLAHGQMPWLVVTPHFA
jgi:hypothetical protein